MIRLTEAGKQAVNRAEQAEATWMQLRKAMTMGGGSRRGQTTRTTTIEQAAETQTDGETWGQGEMKSRRGDGINGTVAGAS